MKASEPAERRTGFFHHLFFLAGPAQDGGVLSQKKRRDTARAALYLAPASGYVIGTRN